MKKIILLSAIVCTIFTILISCGSGTNSQFPRNESFYIGGFQWGTPTTFNPLNDWPSWPAAGQFNLVYESLIGYNNITGEIEPLIAKSHKITSTSIDITIHELAKWSDGTELTTEDVEYTFNIGKRYKKGGLELVRIWEYISGIKVKDKKNLSFILNPNRKNPLVVLDLLMGINIIPKPVFSSLEEIHNNNIDKIADLKMDSNVIASGPYTINFSSDQKIILERVENYWGNDAYFNGKKAAPRFIIHPIYKGNDHYSIALQQGNLDVSATYIARIWKKKKQGVHTWLDDKPYFIPSSFPSLVINHTKKPLDNIKFRQAMAFAINYSDIQQKAVSGYSEDLQPGFILPFGNEAKYFNHEDARKHEISYNPEKAKALLKEAGIVSAFDESGKLIEMKGADGKKIPTLTIWSPAGWSDWETMVKITVAGMRAAGIDVREKFTDANIYYQARPVGEFDIIMDLPNPQSTPSKPWSRFEQVMSSRNFQPVGKMMTKNQGRYKNAEADKLLTAIPKLTDQNKLKAAYRKLNEIFMKELPVIPLVYRPEQFYEFNNKVWKNFPTEKNPYAPPQCFCYYSGVKALWGISSGK